MATKCLYCGADIKPDLRQSFGGVALGPAAFEDVTNLVNNRNDDDARKYLERDFGLDEAEAKSAIDLYKSEHSDLIKSPNWLPWIIILAVALIIVILLI